jgi:phosphoribosylanthranilate isomerase
VQIAGILDEAEANMLVAAGVDDLGFPVGPGVVTPDLSEAEVATVVNRLPASIGAVWITYLADAAAIVDGCRRLGVRKVQLHGDASAQCVRSVKRLAPELFVMKSLIVAATNADALVNELSQFDDAVDCFITDTLDPRTGHRGATGKVHDWSVSARLVSLSSKPVMLAGGLTAENVTAAIQTVRPAAVDAHTGVEGADGRKDPQAVRLFVQRAKAAAALA